MDTAVPLPRAAELNLDDIPYVEGMAITCFPPAAEHMTDPYWYDQGGRNPLVAREIFKLPAGEVRPRRLRDIVHEFKHYGAAMYDFRMPPASDQMAHTSTSGEMIPSNT